MVNVLLLLFAFAMAARCLLRQGKHRESANSASKWNNAAVALESQRITGWLLTICALLLPRVTNGDCSASIVIALFALPMIVSKKDLFAA